MRTILIFLLLICLQCSVRAQSSINLDNSSYAVIKDADGSVNIRELPNSSSPIVFKIYNFSVFSCEPNNTNWWKVFYINRTKDKSDWLEGYIYKDRVTLLTGWENVNSRSVFKDSSVLKKDSLRVVVKQVVFIPSKHKLSYSKPVPGENILSGLIKIDGKHFWGTDETLPKKVIASLKIYKNNTSVIIPDNAYNDLYEPSLKTLAICFGPENSYYIKMTNSDGAGEYGVIWIFKDDEYCGRFIDDSED